jgi:NADH:ubiquinone oxidoreductase subunit E
MSKKTKLLICTNKSCKKRGAKDVLEALEDEIESRGLEDRICVKGTDCLGMCGKGPAVKVKKEKVAFGRVSPEDCLDIIDALIHERSVERFNKIKR